MKQKIYTLLLVIAMQHTLYAQLTIQTPIYIETGAELTVLNLDINSTADIIGSGSLRIKNTLSTNMDFNNNSLSNLIIDGNTTSNVNLLSNVKIANSLQFLSGKINLNNENLILDNMAVTSGSGSNGYAITNGAGLVVKNTMANLTNFIMPVGTTANYLPVEITSTGTYTTGANVTAQAKGGIHPSKPYLSTDYLDVSWPLARTGITGSVMAMATYDGSNIVGNENLIKAAVFSGPNWANLGSNNNIITNNNSAELINATGDLYGMNSFVQLSAKAFLQGPYNASIQLMNDNLRTPTNLIPLSDPYRVTPLSTAFTHTNNAIAEVANSSVFTPQINANNNIVDWVYLELRNNAATTPGANIIKTRSALIQRDGDIVDVDGVSPVYFKDVIPANYSIAIRHRNHLGMCTDPAFGTYSLLMENPSTPIDFTTLSDPAIFGKADSNFKVIGTKNLLYAGNANSNNRVSYINLSNDKDRIFSTLSNQANNLSINNVYHASDINMNRNVRFINLGNDKDFLFSILGNSPSTIKYQTLPQ